MVVYPYSVAGYFALGAVGALAFLFLMLLFDKNVAILENKHVGQVTMATGYMLIGGVVSIVANVAASNEFGPGQWAVAFGAGFSWPALAAGLGASRKIGDLSEERERIGTLAKQLEAQKSKQVEEVQAYFAQRIAQLEQEKEAQIAALQAKVGKGAAKKVNP